MNTKSVNSDGQQCHLYQQKNVCVCPKPGPSVATFLHHQHTKFTLNNSYVFLELVLRKVIFWTAHSSWHKIYSNKTTLILGWSNRCKNYTVLITILVECYEISYIPFYVFYFLSSITDMTFIGLYYIYMSIMTEVLSDAMNCPPFASTWFHLRFLVRFALLFF
jgi:hypothetical protein